MASKPTLFTEKLYKFVFEGAISESDVLARLRVETASHPMAIMQISPVQGAFMANLARIVGARRVLEVGTFTGYSSLAMIEAMGASGRVVTCDISEEYTDIARRYWDEAGVSDQIKLLLGDAVATLDGLIAQGDEETFDIAFIDADKVQYPAYYERAVRLVRSGGLVLLDNMFMDGRVADPADDDDGVSTIRDLYPMLKNDERINFSIVPIADGLGMAYKR